MTAKRMDCVECGRSVAVRPSGALYGHAGAGVDACPGGMGRTYGPKATERKIVDGRENVRGVPKHIETAVFKRDRKRCKKCGGRDDLHLHHVQEFADGGRHEVDNLHTLCAACHDEWTWTPPFDATYEEWLVTVPARWLAHLAIRLRTDAGLQFRLFTCPVDVAIASLDHIRLERIESP